MHEIEQILNSPAKPKEKQEQLTKALKNGLVSIQNLIIYYQSAKDVQKGTLLSSLTQAAKENPDFLKDNIDFVINQIAHKAPRVKWESSEIIANIAEKYPEKGALSIPNLIGNIGNEGTVVRWSTACALAAIAKYNKKAQEQLVPLFEEQLEKEENNGVRKIYEKALKLLSKRNK